MGLFKNLMTILRNKALTKLKLKRLLTTYVKSKMTLQPLKSVNKNITRVEYVFNIVLITLILRNT